MSIFLPTNLEEARGRGWDSLDIIFVTGDAYVDHPSFGVPLVARWLESHGFRVGIIAQPDWRSVSSFMVLGAPRLFFAVSAGAMDSMVAHYTPQKKLRHDDAYTPGGKHGSRPNRATIVYTSRLKEAYRNVPVIIGGIEASMRRFVHYDFWEDKPRRSILLDSKADMLVYGMGERPMLELAKRVKAGEALAGASDVRGTCLVSRKVPDGAVMLPSWDEIIQDKAAFVSAQRKTEHEHNPYCGRTLAQPHADRVLVCNPPSIPLDEAMLDSVYALPFIRGPYPGYKAPIPAFEQIRWSITTHRGCFGGCSFCAIAQHQGKFIQSRSVRSIREEVKRLVQSSSFKGVVSDLGGPTANMYGLSCGSRDHGHLCRRASCLYPSLCKNLNYDDARAVAMLIDISGVKEVKQVMISSGVRHDLIEHQKSYFTRLVTRHVGGLLKIAPEHVLPTVTSLMRKPDGKLFEHFLSCFREESRRAGLRQAVVPYLMAGHPGSTMDSMVELAVTIHRLKLKVEQVQEFTPTPGTSSTCMYYTGIDPDTGNTVYVARNDRERRLQKAALLWHIPEERQRLRKGLAETGRADLLLRLDAIGYANLSGVAALSHSRKKKTPR